KTDSRQALYSVAILERSGHRRREIKGRQRHLSSGAPPQRATRRPRHTQRRGHPLDRLPVLTHQPLGLAPSGSHHTATAGVKLAHGIEQVPPPAGVPQLCALLGRISRPSFSTHHRLQPPPCLHPAARSRKEGWEDRQPSWFTCSRW